VAVENNDFIEVERLVKIINVDVNQITQSQNSLDFKNFHTVLTLASQQGRLKMVELLLKLKADANKTSAWGDTPLYYATVFGHFDVVKLLVKHRADVNKYRSRFGPGPLFFAIRNKHLDIASFLMFSGAKIKETDLALFDEDQRMVLHKLIFEKRLMFRRKQQCFSFLHFTKNLPDTDFQVETVELTLADLQKEEL
jgi:hypothetical protein